MMPVGGRGGRATPLQIIGGRIYIKKKKNGIGVYSLKPYELGANSNVIGPYSLQIECYLLKKKMDENTTLWPQHHRKCAFLSAS